MKENKANKNAEFSSDELNSVAGGNRYDLKVQEIMNLPGFKPEWLNREEDTGWDGDFYLFLEKNYGKRRANMLVDRFQNQKDMFSETSPHR